MLSSFTPMYRLTARGGVGLACDERGIALGPVPLVEALSAGARRVFRPRPAEEIARTLALAYGPFPPQDLVRCLSALDVAARALEAGDLIKASVAAVLLKLPDLTPEAFAKLAGDPLLKKCSPDQSRDERGRSTRNDGSRSDAEPVQTGDAREGASGAGEMVVAQAVGNDASGAIGNSAQPHASI